MPEHILLKPKTPKEKLQNYWYHYKWHTLAAVFVAAVLAVCITQCVNQVKPDYKVMVNISKPIPSEMLDELETELSAFGVDLNGDGIVKVQLIDCSYDPAGNPQMVQAQSTKLQAELSISEAMLIIVDRTMLDRLTGSEAVSGLFDTLPIFPNQSGIAYNLADGPLYNKLNKDDYLPANLYITKRVANRDKESIRTREQQSMELLEKLIAANPQPTP